MNAAKVVDLPEPVRPVTSNNPCVESIKFFNAIGAPSSSSVGIFEGINRNANDNFSR